jgi:hypothetical protein
MITREQIGSRLAEAERWHGPMSHEDFTEIVKLARLGLCVVDAMGESVSAADLASISADVANDIGPSHSHGFAALLLDALAKELER